LQDEAGHPRAQEEYYRIQLGSLERLAQPIVADKWRRITFLYTTGAYLLRARTLNDLVVAYDERATLWRSLRERAAGAETYQATESYVDIPPDELMALLGLREPDSTYDSMELD
jgi:hypothetical protein